MKRQITKFKIVQIVEIVIPPKKIIQIANKHMKWCLTALAIKEMQIITTVECHFTPTSVLIIIKIKPDKSKCWQACGEIRTSYISDKSVKYFSFGKEFSRFSNVKHIIMYHPTHANINCLYTQRNENIHKKCIHKCL